MRKPLPEEFDDGTGNIDFDEYYEVLGDYEDEQYSRYRDEIDDIGDNIHEQRRDEKDEDD
jgi:hypothetical protein